MRGDQRTKIIISVALLIAIDLTLKAIVVRSFERTEMKEIVPGILSVGRIETLRGAFGFQNNAFLILASHLVFQLLVVLLAVRVSRRKVHPLFFLALTMIIGGWVGEYFDWIFFGEGRLAYVSFAYFYFHFLDPVFSLSSLVISGGSVLLLFCIVVFFKDLKLIFQPVKVIEDVSKN